MSDEVHFDGLDDPRRLPEQLRTHLDRRLRGLEPLDETDAPRAVPEGARDKLLDALSEPAEDLLAGIDGPRALPATLRSELTGRLTRPGDLARPGFLTRPVLVRVLAIAASLVLLAASTVAITWTGERDGPAIVGGAPFDGDAALGLDDAPLNPGSVDDGAIPGDLGGPVTLGPPAMQPDAAMGGGGGASAPPPFSFQDAPAAVTPDGAFGGARGSAGSPLVVAAAHGGGAQDEGFAAYIALLNRTGGVRGHRLEIVPAGSADAARAIATVNLTAAPLDDQTIPRPILESIAAPEGVLRGATFGFAAPPERQGHLIAERVYPEPAPGRTAVIYHTDEPGWRDRIADAIASVLRAREVTVLRIRFEPQNPVLLPADAAFLSMPTDAARAWLASARSTGYRPERGVAGIYSLADPALLEVLPEGARLISPYVFAAGEEREAMRRETAHPLSAELIHGWVTAKSVAVAIWLSGATDAASLTRALGQDLPGYRNGFAPAYEVRPQTRARTPEGLLYRVESGAFVARSGFLRDPF